MVRMKRTRHMFVSAFHLAVFNVNKNNNNSATFFFKEKKKHGSFCVCVCWFEAILFFSPLWTSGIFNMYRGGNDELFMKCSSVVGRLKVHAKQT